MCNIKQSISVIVPNIMTSILDPQKVLISVIIIIIMTVNISNSFFGYKVSQTSFGGTLCIKFGEVPSDPRNHGGTGLLLESLEITGITDICHWMVMGQGEHKMKVLQIWTYQPDISELIAEREFAMYFIDCF